MWQGIDGTEIFANFITARRVDFDNEIHWQRQHQVLKVAFPLDLHANEATYEIQYGHIRRPTHQNTSWDAVKKAEADDGMIVRLYDSFDMRCTVTVTVAEGFQKAYLCDLMENPLEELPFDGHTVTLPVKNFEIVTLKFS